MIAAVGQAEPKDVVVVGAAHYAHKVDRYPVDVGL